jgi:hypothetical protein
MGSVGCIIFPQLLIIVLYHFQCLRLEKYLIQFSLLLFMEAKRNMYLLTCCSNKPD